MNNPQNQRQPHPGQHHYQHHPYQHPQQNAEKVIRVIKQSRRAIFGNYIAIAGLFYFSYYSFLGSIDNPNLKSFAWLFLASGAAILAYSEFQINSKKLIITSKRAILNEGILSKNNITIKYSSITEIISKQMFHQRILNYGKLSIRTAGMNREEDLTINHIPSPDLAKRMLEHFMIGEHKV